MRLQTRLAKLERAASRPPVDLAAILAGVAEQVGHRDRETLHAIIVDWRAGGSRFGALVAGLELGTVELVIAALDRAGVRAADDGVGLQCLADVADDPSLSDADRETVRRMLKDVRSGGLHPRDVIPRLNDAQLAAFDAALRMPPPRLRVVSADDGHENAQNGPCNAIRQKT